MADSNKQREKFSSKFGVLMAMAGSAIGLGNMWRFPYLTAENGGAAFILIYVVLMCTMSLPLFITEFLIGRRTRSNAIGAFSKLGFPKLKFIGAFGVLAAVCVLSFYSVVGGWAVKYLTLAVSFRFQSPAADYAGMFNSFVSSAWSPVIFTLIFIGATSYIILGGVKQGIEKFSKVMMVILFIIIIVVAIRAVTLPGAMDGIRYLFVPDFRKVTGSTIVAALGQSFFSLGLGCGTILIYGSYVKSQDDITTSSIATAFLDTMFAIVAGIAIIPAIFAIASINGTVPDVNAGPGLVFITLPGIFSSMPFGNIAAILFFLSLLLAAITSSVSLMESITAFFIERYGKSRTVSVLMAFAICGTIGIFCSLSQGPLAEVRLLGLNLFDFFDKTSSNVLMTFSGLFMLCFAGWIMKKEDFMDELGAHGHSSTAMWLQKTFYILVRYIAPFGVIAIILGNLLL
ncbi:MAG: sodium-dependent transporter [Bacteroidaceae bacterium]|nr:sodium-dependent transporter [Bacteroidaceae bacterium]